MRLQLTFDAEIPKQIQGPIAKMIKEDCTEVCECGCNELYVAALSSSRSGKVQHMVLDAKCYDCGEPYAEYEIEIMWP